MPSWALPTEKLTCLPEPLTPANGFSWNRHSMPCFLATVLNTVISSCWWSEAMLARSNIGAISNCAGRDLVVAGLGGDAELEELTLGVHHEAQHALGDRAEVVVVELLALGRLRAEQRAAGVDEIGTGQEEVPVDEEVLLLGAAERDHLVEVLVPEQLQDPLGVHAHRLLAAQQRGLVVQRLTGHRHEHRRDAQRVAVRVLQDVGRAGDVPPGVAARLEGRAQAARREAGRVRLTLDQGLAGELGQRLARRRRVRGSCRASRRSDPVIG